MVDTRLTMLTMKLIRPPSRGSRQAGRQARRQAGRQAGRPAGRQAGGQAGKQAGTQASGTAYLCTPIMWSRKTHLFTKCTPVRFRLSINNFGVDFGFGVDSQGSLDIVIVIIIYHKYGIHHIVGAGPAPAVWTSFTEGANTNAL